jgi:probable rRNA maturation factor
MKTGNSIDVIIQKNVKNRFSKKELKIVTEKILAILNMDQVEVTISLVDGKTIHDLNYQYRGLDAETDVLSFEGAETNPENGLRSLGDIAISVPVADLQASRVGHSLESEVYLLTIHGILHLMGYDHSTASEEKLMFDLQSSIHEKITEQ